jgi:uncharacterized membrane protein YccC
MHKKLRKILIIVVCILAALLLMHFTMNYFVPFIQKMHSGMI